MRLVFNSNQICAGAFVYPTFQIQHVDTGGNNMKDANVGFRYQRRGERIMITLFLDPLMATIAEIGTIKYKGFKKMVTYLKPPQPSSNDQRQYKCHGSNID